MKKIVSLLVLPFLLSVASAKSMEDAALKELSIRSEWWPEKVTVRESIISPVNGKKIKAGRQGFVVRLVEDDVLIDFGRYGVIELPVEETNFVEKSQELRDTREWGHLGIWTAQLHTKLMRPAEDGFRPIPITTYDEVDYFILVYLDSQTDEGQTILDWMRDAEAIKNLPVSECLAIIPADDSVEDYYLELVAYDYPGLTLTYPLAKPYHNILNHKPGVASVAVIDKNGREIFPSTPITVGQNLNDLFDALQRRISQDEEARNNINVSE